jgi:hypothetical protein
MTKSYRTASPFLYSLQEQKKKLAAAAAMNGSSGTSGTPSLEEAMELQALVKSITDTLDDLSISTVEDARTRYISTFQFEPVGCQWLCQFPSSMGLQGRYFIRIVCLAAPSHGSMGMNYVMDAHLMGEGEGLGEAKTAFDYVALQIRKAVVQCEFPEFPEGCKGRPFREVYQLNARVSV